MHCAANVPLHSGGLMNKVHVCNTKEELELVILNAIKNSLEAYDNRIVLKLKVCGLYLLFIHNLFELNPMKDILSIRCQRSDTFIEPRYFAAMDMIYGDSSQGALLNAYDTFGERVLDKTYNFDFEKMTMHLDKLRLWIDTRFIKVQ